MSQQPWKRFQILSLDGGGIKGLFSAAVLAKLEEDLHTNINDHFDLIVGTSTGGIIALALGLGITPREIVQFYVEKGPKIFGNTIGVRNISHWIFRKFDQAPLQEALVERFQGSRLADSKKRLVITSYNLGEDDIYIFKTPHHERLRRDYTVPMWKVALATSAAPTYFPAFKGIDSIRLIDGGVWANNPTMVGVVEATSMLDVPLPAISVLSLGTSDEIVSRPRWLDWGGKLPWTKSASAIEVIMRGQSLGAQKQAVHLLGAERIKRLDPKVPRGLLALDRVNSGELLSRAACESRNFGPMFEKVFMSHKASPYEPLYT